jgi:hypothetical protein
VSLRTLAFGAFKVVGTNFNIDPKTVANPWHSTLDMEPGYQSNAPIDTKVIADSVPAAAFEMKFANVGRKPQFDGETVLLTLQTVMNKIIKEIGDNKFKIPRMNKERLERTKCTSSTGIAGASMQGFLVPKQRKYCVRGLSYCHPLQEVNCREIDREIDREIIIKMKTLVIF